MCKLSFLTELINCIYASIWISLYFCIACSRATASLLVTESDNGLSSSKSITFRATLGQLYAQ